MRYNRFPMGTVLATGLGLVLLCCATERPTETRPPQPLIAWEISRDPALYTGPIVSGRALDDSTFDVVFGPAFDSLPPGVVDIKITSVLKQFLVRANLYVQSSQDSSYRVVQLRDPNLESGRFDPRSSTVSLRKAGIVPNDVLGNLNHRLVCRSEDVVAVSAQIIIIDPEYQAITLPLNSHTHGLMWRNDRLYTIGRFWDANGVYFDSLLVFLNTGERSAASPYPFPNQGPIWSMISTGDNIWVMLGSRPIRYILCDSSFTELQEFRVEDFGDRYSAGIILRGDEFWLWDKYEDRLIRIDVANSLATGQAVIADSVLPAKTVRGPQVGSSDGQLLYIVGSVGPYEGFPLERTRAFNSIGDHAFDLPVLRGCNGLSWDGGSFWAIHQGHLGASSDQFVISRFVMR